jgi:hypothetical protein
MEPSDEENGDCLVLLVDLDAVAMTKPLRQLLQYVLSYTDLRDLRVLPAPDPADWRDVSSGPDSDSGVGGYFSNMRKWLTECFGKFGFLDPGALRFFRHVESWKTRGNVDVRVVLMSVGLPFHPSDWKDMVVDALNRVIGAEVVSTFLTLDDMDIRCEEKDEGCPIRAAAARSLQRPRECCRFAVVNDPECASGLKVGVAPFLGPVDRMAALSSAFRKLMGFAGEDMDTKEAMHRHLDEHDFYKGCPSRGTWKDAMQAVETFCCGSERRRSRGRRARRSEALPTRARAADERACLAPSSSILN